MVSLLKAATMGDNCPVTRAIPLSTISNSSSTTLPHVTSNPSLEPTDKATQFACPFQQAEEFRARLRKCGKDTERDQLCQEKRHELLHQHYVVQGTIVEFDKVMIEECEAYKQRRQCGRPKSLTRDYEAEWERFFDITEAGNRDLSNCKLALKPVIENWGWERVNHYRWLYQGLTHCELLHATSNKIRNWDELYVKVPQLQLRRTQLPWGQLIRFTVDLLEPSNLKYIKD